MSPSQRFKLGVFPDFREEGWPSMDLCAEMLVNNLPAQGCDVTAVASRYRRLTGQRNLDRLINRMLLYPRAAGRLSETFDAFHIVDHSYAQLVHALPPRRAGVFCHDLDTFRSVLDPPSDPRPRWFRAMTRRILRGLQQAAVVFYTTEGIREQILEHALLPADRLVKCPLGIAPEFKIDPASSSLFGQPYLLHVGSCIARKRIDVLLNVLADVRRTHPQVQLIKAGGAFTAEQDGMIDRMSLRGQINVMTGVSRATLARLYQHAAAVLQPSDAEGFGLPVVEALACGATVVASDIPVLREVGGDAALYCPVADVPSFSDAVRSVLENISRAPMLSVKLTQAGRYSWAEHARVIAQAYENLLHH